MKDVEFCTSAASDGWLASRAISASVELLVYLSQRFVRLAAAVDSGLFCDS